MSGPASLDCAVPSGSVVVESGTDDSVHISVDTPKPDAWHIGQTGDQISVIFDRGPRSGGGRAHIRVLLPDHSSVKISTATADVRLTARLGRTSVSTASGDIHIGTTRSAVIKTASGDVILDSVEEDLTVKSASGDIRVGRTGGTTSLTTASGDMDLGRAEGPLVASSASGDVRIGTYLGNDVEAATMSGDVSMALPSGIRVDFKARTLSGRVSLPERRQPSGTADRDVTVRLRSISGDIRVTRTETT